MSRNALCFSINFDMGNLNLFSNIQDVSTQSDPHRIKCLLNRWTLDPRIGGELGRPLDHLDASTCGHRDIPVHGGRASCPQAGNLVGHLVADAHLRLRRLSVVVSW